MNCVAGDRLIDIGAGSGGAALIAAARGADVLPIDAAPQWWRAFVRARTVPRIAGPCSRRDMDGMALALPDASFDAAISVFGVILFPDAELGMREIARVLKPGGRAAVVTWTEMERYELAVRLLAAIAAVRGPQPPPASLPAQLRFRDETVFREAARGRRTGRRGHRARSRNAGALPSARWIAEHIAFAPGMAAMVGGLGGRSGAGARCLRCRART